MIRSGKEFILNLHGLGTPHVGVDAGEARFWMSVDTFEWVLDRVAEGCAVGAPIKLSFDDGNLSDLEIALPRLIDRGLSAQFFVLVGRIGQPAYLDEEGIRALHASGMGIGLHGRHHLDWRGLDVAGLEDETVAARNELGAILGSSVDSVAMPFGAYRHRTISWLCRQNFAAIYTTDGGPASPARRVRPRTSLTGDIEGPVLEAILADRLPIWKRARRSLSALLRRNLI